MVILKFKSGAPERAVADFFARLRAMQSLIPGMKRIAFGPYASHEGLNQGFTHGLLIEFDTLESRDAYLVHPEHERIKNAIWPHVEDVIAVDFAT